MSEGWYPFGMAPEDRHVYDVLVDGIPDWLREPLFEWMREVLGGAEWISTGFVLDLQLATRIDLEVRSGSVLSGDDVVRKARGLEDLEILRLLDYLLSRLSRWDSDPAAVRLSTTLAAGRSRWTVGSRDGSVGLVERVPIGVQVAAEEVSATSDSAGEVLARAWANVHGLDPSASSAYADAVRAVEIAAIAVVQPNHAQATLGTVLGQMTADGDWGLPLREDPRAPGPELVISMGRTLWTGHRDRHGSANYVDVTLEEASTAVTLAVTLVDWFHGGRIARRP